MLRSLSVLVLILSSLRRFELKIEGKYHVYHIFVLWIAESNRKSVNFPIQLSKSYSESLLIYSNLKFVLYNNDSEGCILELVREVFKVDEKACSVKDIEITNKTRLCQREAEIYSPIFCYFSYDSRGLCESVEILLEYLDRDGSKMKMESAKLIKPR